MMIKEERPDPDNELILRAEKNLDMIRQFCADVTVLDVDIFADDGAVVGGHNIVRLLNGIDPSSYTDILIDMSALSLGVSFPVVLFFYEYAKSQGEKVNVHIALMSNPQLDSVISSESNDQPSYARGFDKPELFGDSEKALLWLPVVSESKHHNLKLIHTTQNPHDTCPIIPFPSEDPKKGDRIAYGLFSSIQVDFGGPLENEWALEPQNFLYSDERRPLDIYRTIIRLADERTPIFKDLGGSTILLSPLGSKIPALGALMAALERQFPVVYVESLAYNVDWDKVDNISDSETRMVHVWLHGEAYLADQ